MHKFRQIALAFIGTVALSLISTPATSNAVAADQTNFVLIMADDLGYGDVSCYRSAGVITKNPFSTPHLDLMAQEGLRFTDYHSNGTVCSPTRAALLTGRYQQRSGVDEVINADPGKNRDTGLAVDEITFAEVLQSAGYQTAVIGKWHLGYDVKFNPTFQGFDYFRGYVSGNIDYISHLDRTGVADWWHNEKLEPEPGYTTHLVTRHALEFIRQQQTQPFCLYVAHEAVHAPYQGPHDPAVRKAGQNDQSPEKAARNQNLVYAEMITELDRGVGEILSLLRELKLERNTLVIFISDNGANTNGNNGALRGFKGSVWEGGHRVPCIAWQPGVISPGETAETVLSMDWFPTLASIGQAEVPRELALDGVNLANLIYHQQPLAPRSVFWRHGTQWAVRQGQYKALSLNPNMNPQLFNLRTDLPEQVDLATNKPEILQELLEQYGAWSADLLIESTEALEVPPDQ